MQFSELVTAVEDVVDDEAYTTTIVKARINESVLRIATGVTLPDQRRISPPLPGLYTSDDIDTTLSSGITDLPDDFNRDLLQVINSDDEGIKIEPSLRRFLSDHPEQDAGSVYTCCVYGGRLLYRDIPSAAETLTVHYYKNPATLTNDADTPSDIPIHLHRKLIVGHTLMEIYREIELGMAGKKVDTEYYTRIFNEGLIELSELYPPDEPPQYYEDSNDYIS